MFFFQRRDFFPALLRLLSQPSFDIQAEKEREKEKKGRKGAHNGLSPPLSLIAVIVSTVTGRGKVCSLLLIQSTQEEGTERGRPSAPPYFISFA
mmetsp:Transcript_40058/g.78972  ORF Transcript_40058/g.78972 Transcript_40058/m.78972 type:complete len:94 (+) Transcript_40058:1196-1477(+)